ncbi:MAG TPA: AAA family ATPase, partial [Gammaproteobacteria bacterium]|nr:AAA family ATPase [Gammaproteobacteria bacterium]
MAALELLVGQKIITSLDLHFAELMCRLSADTSAELALAAALTSSAIGKGHVCIQLDSFAGSGLGNPMVCRLPVRAEWEQRLHASPVVGAPGDFSPLILDRRGRLYLQRYWQYEHNLAQALLRRAAGCVEAVDEARLKQTLDLLFPDGAADTSGGQRLAAAAAVLRNFILISGGPGTGKTSIVVRILGLLQQQAGGALDIALTAPTGKAATRLQAAIRQAKLTLPLSRDLLSAIPEQATTIHRLLGSRPDSAQFRYHAGNPLPVDALVMDEASMVDVALMARLLQALPAQCRLILLGDRHQ